MIKPTIGRKVWYWPSKNDKVGRGAMQCNAIDPLDATVVAVHGDRMVNLVVFDHNGNQHKCTSVTLKQEGDITREGEAFAEWMPYQITQAAKQEPVEPVAI